jgi:hypothetical protein
MSHAKLLVKAKALAIQVNALRQRTRRAQQSCATVPKDDISRCDIRAISHRLAVLVRENGASEDPDAVQSTVMAVASDMLRNITGGPFKRKTYSSRTKVLLTILRKCLGQSAYNLLGMNLGLAHNRTVEQWGENPTSFRSGVVAANFKAAGEIMRLAKAAAGIKGPVPVQLAEDETGIEQKIEWDPRTDTTEGFCGLQCDASCVSVQQCRQRIKRNEAGACTRVHQCSSEL